MLSSVGLRLLPCGVPFVRWLTLDFFPCNCTVPVRFVRSRKIVAERDVYSLLRAVIGYAVCISVVMASIVSTPLMKPRE